MNDKEKKEYFALLEKWFAIAIPINASYPTLSDDRLSKEVQENA